MPTRKSNRRLLGLTTLLAVAAASKDESEPATTIKSIFSSSTNVHVHDTQTASLGGPIDFPPELKEMLEQLAASSASNPSNPSDSESNTFRIDFGTPEFMQADAGSDSPSKSTRQQFIDRMNAARKPSKQKSWDTDYEPICSSSAYLEAEIFPFDPASPHPGWAWAFERLDACQHGGYPGGFSEHDTQWRLIRADFDALSKPVRDYFTEHPDNGMLCVVDGVAFFPPGVVLAWMPLFASTGAGECDGKFGGLERYGQDVMGERVGGKLVGKTEIGTTLNVKVEVELMRRKREGKDEL